MAVMLRVGSALATYDDEQWTCDDPDVRRLLEAVTSSDWGGQYRPRVDLAVAEAVVERLGDVAELVWVSWDRPMPPGTVRPTATRTRRRPSASSLSATPIEMGSSMPTTAVSPRRWLAKMRSLAAI